MSVPEHGAVICVEHENKQDIRTYIEETLRKETLNEEQVQKITNKIVSKASGIFQWVSLVVRKVIRQFRSGANTTTILKEIDKLPSELAGLYEDILARLEDRPKSLLLMQWICFAVWPLSLGEIRFAFVVDPAKPYTSLKEYEEEDEDFLETDEQMERKLKSLSGGLAEVQDHDGARVVQFIHQSVQDYLKQKGLQKLDESPPTTADERTEKDPEAEAHFRIWRSCTRYLSMIEVSSIPGNHKLYGGDNRLKPLEPLEQSRQQLCNDFPFIQYCVRNWVTHAKNVEEHGVRQHDLPQMFQWPSNQVIQLWAHLHIMMAPFPEDRPTSGMSFLHVASQHGLLTTIKAIFSKSKGVEMEPKDNAGRTPLLYAAGNGHKAVVKLLLENGANPNTKDGMGTTPLLWAIRKTEEAVVKLLLENGADPNVKDKEGETSLLCAIRKRDEAVVELLLENGADPNAKDNHGLTSLWWATFLAKDEAVVKLLLEKGADPNAKDDDMGITPLSCAIRRTNEAMVKLLLDNGADPNAKDDIGTPLSCAIREKHEAVVKLLLEKGADPNAKDDNIGITLLSCAIRKTDQEVIELLLEYGADPNVTEEEGDTPLSQAVECEQEEVVKLLLKKGANADSKNNAGQTPLFFAAARGHETMVSLLLAKDIDDRRTQDLYSQTPLLLAAGNGQEAIVKLLIAQDVTGLFSKDRFGRTPLSWAAQKGYLNIVKILCEKYCEDGRVIHAEDINLGTPPAPDQPCRIVCDICLSWIPDIDIRQHCEICQYGDFDLCQDCFHCGAFCLDNSHKMVKRTLKMVSLWS